jgi:mannose-1-phosphate guanylyltransferase
VTAALLLAAGVGSRLRPLTDVLPKCLMPICGRPLLGIWLDMLAVAEIAPIVVNTHHHAGLVQAYLARSPHKARIVVAHEPDLLGTGGTLAANHAALGDDAVLLAHADNLSAFDPRAFAAAFVARPAASVLTMMTFDTDAPQSCGIVETDAQGLVQGFHEKVANPPGTRANAAVYMVGATLRAMVRNGGASTADFSTGVLPRMLGRMDTFHNATYHRDIGAPESFLRAQVEYPLRVGLSPALPDPWFGLMTEHNGALARAFAAALAATRV